jgi:hypothetical protein
VADTCSGQSIAPGTSCSLTVLFSPLAEGTFDESFDIPSNDPDEQSVTISLLGTGLSSGNGEDTPDITITDPVVPVDDLQLSFGEVTRGNSSVKVVTVGNSGNTALEIYDIAQADPLAMPFSIAADACSGQSIAPGTSCSLTVLFSPAAEGAFDESFDIPSNDPDEQPVTVSLMGTGLSSANNNKPSKPALVFPGNGNKGLAKKVGFKWKKSHDPDGDNVTYSLYLDEDPLFSNTEPIVTASIAGHGPLYADAMGPMAGLLIAGIVLAGGTMRRRRLIMLLAVLVLAGLLMASCGAVGGTDQPDGDEVSLVVSGLKDNTTYYWKVVAEDEQGGTTESDVRSFTTE